MTIPKTLIAILAATLANLSAGAQTIGKPAPDLIAIREDGGSKNDKWHVIKDQRGHMVVYYFWRASSRESVNGLATVKKLVDRFKSKGVRFIPVSVDSKERWEEFTKDHGKPEGTYVHQGRHMGDELGALSEPHVVIIDGRLIIRWRGPPDDLLADRLKYLVKRFPPPAGDKQWLSSRLRESEKLLDRGEIGRAYSKVKEVFDFTDEASPQHAEAQGRMEKLESAASKWINEAIQAEKSGDYDRAAHIVTEISVRLKDTDVAHDAEEEVGRMNGRRELKEKIRLALKNAEAQVKLDEADELAASGDYDAALAIYKKVRDNEDYEDTEAVKIAKRKIARIQKDPEIRAAVAKARAQQRADRYLNLAEEYARTEMFDEARTYYQKLLDEYPDSAAARLARKLEKRLPG